jgi:hypothetical protein
MRNTVVDFSSSTFDYNNGIVATVDHLDLETDSAGNTGIGSVRGLQIVNGGGDGLVHFVWRSPF